MPDLRSSAAVVLVLAACSANGGDGSGAAAGGHGGSAVGVGGTAAGSAGTSASGGGAGAPGGTSGASTGGASGASSGGTSSGGSGATGGNGGSTSGITFDWPETQPGAACKAGRYGGKFQCTYKNPSGGGAIQVTGPLTLTLKASVNGEFLDVSDGLLDGKANGIFAIKANVVGKLDCTTNQFAGHIANGTYSAFLLISGTFHGDVTSKYDALTHAFVNGTWALVDDASQGGCNGTWGANYLGP